MENRSDRFGSGFIAGAVFGSIVGAFAAVFLTNKLAELEAGPPNRSPAGGRLPLGMNDETAMESARQGLEAKIAQLNDAVDDLQQRLSTVSESNDL
ncbi:hypothetical protein [Synechococcus sp. PCC 6312]|uniref:hypothetical protein n=1 Tax=Synechococcus sp. (strain ATCC 27167 / PCC 6312) TaxID=195253 RepID=UPI00029EEE75|nr:hypothetical protein [Synechococcus sp. PCC 6312]AFY59288.1 hypothetical protein Syn6312_0030 [Synechococcus sp. PCC 6312]